MTEEEEKALITLYNLDHYVLPQMNNLNYADPAVQYCMEQAKFHLTQAQELLEGAVLDPQKHYDDASEFYQTLSRVLPLMVLLRSFGSPPLDPDEEESSQHTQSSDQSDEDSFEPATPPGH